MKYLILLIFLVGCTEIESNNEWAKAPRQHNCTTEQMKKVEQETKFCNENTTFYKTYCYGSAIMRNCTKIKNEVEK